MATLVDADLRDGVKQYLSRALEEATPGRWVEGGATESDRQHFTTRPRTYEQLKRNEEIYKAGGPVTDLIDSRALMTYGVGVEFASESLLSDDQGRTVDEWLAAQFGETLDYLHIRLGTQSYWAGDAWAQLVETRGGDFSHLALVDPTTVDADWDRHGELTDLEQIIVEGNQPRRQPLDTDRVAHFTYKETTGGPLGQSLIEQNYDEIERYAQNQRQRANAIQLHGSPKYDVSVGSEGQSIPDKIMRRVRNKFRSENVDEKTTWTHGGDIEIETLASPGFEGMDSITETDLQLLASGFGIPLEWTNFGSDGLGSGTPAESRQTKFERQARAEQALQTKQFIEQVVRPLLELYSPFPREIDVTLQWGDVVSDQQAVVDAYAPVQWAYTRDELREKMGDQPFDDTEDSDAPPEVSPAAQDTAAEGEPGSEPFGRGLGTGNGHDGRALFHDGVSDGDLSREELVWERVYEDVLWNDDATDRQLFEFDPEEVPDFVVRRLEDAVRAGALFEGLDTLGDAAEAQLRDVMLDSLETQHGWSVRSIANNLQDADPTLDPADAERIARTETQALVNQAREEGYREREDVDDARFYWQGPADSRETEACEWLKAQTNPQHGGEPVALEELQALVAEANDRFVDHDGRKYTPHISCRHTFVRRVE